MTKKSVEENLDLKGDFMKKLTFIGAFLLLVLGSTIIFFKYYSYIFSRNVSGTIMMVERPHIPTALIGVSESGATTTETKIYDYAVAIKESTGEIVTASTEDRQWAVAQKGQCAEAKYYPYPPWDLARSGTYHSARLLKLFDCLEEKVGGVEETIEGAEVEGVEEIKATSETINSQLEEVEELDNRDPVPEE